VVPELPRERPFRLFMEDYFLFLRGEFPAFLRHIEFERFNVHAASLIPNYTTKIPPHPEALSGWMVLTYFTFYV
jgi:hypothetical protein